MTKVQCIYCERWIDSLLLNCPHCSRSTHDEKSDALTDMAYYHGARHAMAALSAGMDPATRDRARSTLETYPVEKRCTRSHPHELMDEHCKTMAWIEQASAAMRLAEDATLKASAANRQVK